MEIAIFVLNYCRNYSISNNIANFFFIYYHIVYRFPSPLLN